MSSRKSGKNVLSKDPHRLRESENYQKPIASREFILEVLQSEAGPVELPALAQILDIDSEDGLEALRRRVGAMLRDGQLIENRRRGLLPVDTDTLFAGRISAHPDGFGFVVVDDGDSDVYLSAKQMRQVLHGDRVVVSVIKIDGRGRREGRIVEIVERVNHTLVGRISSDRGTVIVQPDSKRIHQDLLVAAGELGTAENGDMVLVEIIEQPTRRHQPVVRVIEVLGQHLQPGMEIDVALHSHGIPDQWPDAVLAEAAAFGTSVSASVDKSRKDIRETALVTIDGEDARDFDDAVWCKKLRTGGWRLIVAIADVAHYVEPESAVDVEAQERGTSVYFPGRVVPMLPETLSNGLCSLNPEVDRFCMVCEMTLDASGEVNKRRFYNALMRSHARLTYDQVNRLLSEQSEPLLAKYASLLPMINNLHELYRVLAEARRQRGAIEFDSTETRIVFDDNKKIKEIVPVVRNDAHKLIEECMILANVQAADFVQTHDVPALYRVHAGPKSERLDDLRSFLALRGLSLGGGDKPTALDFARLAESIRELPDRSVIQTVMLRSMQQAVYQPVNDGHFGLALEQYAHFTSPIRRYPDLLLHRAIKHILRRGKKKSFMYTASAMQSLGERCSMTERRAEEASRDVVAWLKCEYMQNHVGDEFPGVISAVTSFGLFIELDGIHIEGLVHVTNLSRDYYRFEQNAQALVGERTGKLYQLGDVMLVQVAAVNLEERKIDFAEISHSPREVDKGAGKKRKTDGKLAGKPGSEQRRQAKRQRKQQRRDDKRAAAKALEDKANGTPLTEKRAGKRGTGKAVGKKITAKSGRRRQAAASADGENTDKEVKLTKKSGRSKKASGIGKKTAAKRVKKSGSKKTGVAKKAKKTGGKKKVRRGG
ncbi:MAG: ribonuclease R [Granulosicoccus sp.]